MNRHSTLPIVRVRAVVLILVAAMVGTFAWEQYANSASAAVAPVSIFGNAAPAVAADPDTVPVELGLQFRSTAAGQISGIRFYKATANTGTHVGSLRRGSTLLASVTFTGETAVGWQQMRFSSPVAISPGTTYTVSYLAPQGRYAADNPYHFPSTTGSLTAIKGVYRYGGGNPTSVYQATNYWVDVLFVADAPVTTPVTSSSSSTISPTTSTTIPTTTTTDSTSSPTSSTASPTTITSATTTPAPSAGFPDASNTGVPAGVALSNYTGPCTITAASTVISGKLIGCDLIIKAANVSVTDSRINGRLLSNTSGASVTVQDSEINGGNQETFPSVSYQNLTLRRVEVTGGQHSVQCSANCTVADSWLHNQYIGAGSTGHVNAFISNGGSGFTLTHNTLHCTVQPTGTGGGCTADASLFGDFGSISNAKFDGNLFKANSTGAGYCLQAGYNPGKSFPNPTGVVITNNVFERGTNGKCGIYGAVTAFKADAPGDVWSGNTFDNGAVIKP